MKIISVNYNEREREKKGLFDGKEEMMENVFEYLAKKLLHYVSD